MAARSAGDRAALYRRSTVWCDQVLATTAVAGRSARGIRAWRMVATCRIDGGGQVDVALGWALQPAPVSWTGGKVSGIVASGAGHSARLIADPPQAGLAPWRVRTRATFPTTTWPMPCSGSFSPRSRR
jgi:surfeit locus 1 family protein